MKKHAIVAATALAGIGLSGLGFSNSVYAATSPVISGDGTETCIQGPALNEGAQCTVHILTADDDWQPENPLGSGAKWISYANTSLPGNDWAPAGSGTKNPDGTTVLAYFQERLQRI